MSQLKLCVHHWMIDNKLQAHCKHCGTLRDFHKLQVEAGIIVKGMPQSVIHAYKDNGSEYMGMKSKYVYPVQGSLPDNKSFDIASVLW